MHLIDWLIVVVPLLMCGSIALYTRRYCRSVTDFIAGGRHAGRFLVCTAKSEQGAGAVVYVSTFQQMAVAGFTLTWWGQLAVPVGLIVAISGFVIYRYRQTRALTLAQFFEMRYSRSFRLVAGVLAFVAGVLNFGIIPVIGAKFVQHFLALPPTLDVLGHAVPTYLPLMAGFLSCCVLMTIAGGQVTVLVTDCCEGMFSQLFYVFIAAGLLITYLHWPAVKTALLDAAPGESLVNPFDSFALKDFNIWYVLMNLYVGVYSTMAWQNSHAFNASASSAHESRMGGILGRWRGFASTVMVTLLAVCAIHYLKTAEGRAVVNAAVANIPDAATGNQMRVPIALAHLMPIGVKGAFLAVCLMGIIAGDGIHLHSWGSIFVQDVVLPIREFQGKTLSPRAHLRLLRLAIVGVAVWAFCFGALFAQTEYVQFWWAVTQGVFTGGAGAAIIGGLYWSRGTTQAAWAALAVGAGYSFAGICARAYAPSLFGVTFPLNGIQIAFVATLLAMATYVVVSLLTCRAPHDMDRLLNRGIYRVEPEGTRPAAAVQTARVSWLYRAIGVDEQFTRNDRWITAGIFAYTMIWVVCFAVGSIAYQFTPWSSGTWAEYWRWVAIYLPLAIGAATTIWFTIGCTRDLRHFFRDLRRARVDAADDGTIAREPTPDAASAHHPA